MGKSGIREAILEAISGHIRQASPLYSARILCEVADKLHIDVDDFDMQQELIAAWYSLIESGTLTYQNQQQGSDLFLCHLTKAGEAELAEASNRVCQ